MPQAKELRIGLSISLTGKFSRQGHQALNAVRLWAAYTDEQGGVAVGDAPPRRVRILYYDDESRAAKTRENIARLVQKKRAHILLGPYSSGLTMAAAEIAGEYRRLMFSHGGTSDAIYQRGFSHVIGVASPASEYFRGLPLWLEKHVPELRTILVAHSPAGTFAAKVMRGITEAAVALGHQSVELLALGTHKPADLVRELESRRPQVVVLASTFEEEIRMLESRPLWPESVECVAAVAAGVQAFREQLGEPSEGMLGPSQWEPAVIFPERIGPGSAWFCQSFEQRFAGVPDYPAAAAFAAGLIVGECIQRAGSLEQGKLRDAVSRLDCDTFFGRFRIDPSTGRQTGHRMLLVEWSGGRKIVLAGDEVSRVG
jgi:branched-chain amino acid transport system substrate-binding protein